MALGTRAVRFRDQRCPRPPHPWPSAQTQVPDFPEVHLLSGILCFALINLLNPAESGGNALLPPPTTAAGGGSQGKVRGPSRLLSRSEAGVGGLGTPSPLREPCGSALRPSPPNP